MARTALLRILILASPTAADPKFMCVQSTTDTTLKTRNEDLTIGKPADPKEKGKQGRVNDKCEQHKTSCPENYLRLDFLHRAHPGILSGSAPADMDNAEVHAFSPSTTAGPISPLW